MNPFYQKNGKIVKSPGFFRLPGTAHVVYCVGYLPEMFAKIFYFLFFTSIGLSILKYRKTVFEWTGRWYWAEKYLGNGGTILVISLIGLGCMFFGIGYPLGAFDDMFKRGAIPEAATVQEGNGGSSDSAQ
jgi:hypothetical protein